MRLEVDAGVVVRGIPTILDMLLPEPDADNRQLSALGVPALVEAIRARMAAEGRWWPFDRYMAAALYTPGLGYYSGGKLPLGMMPGGGSDFVTAPELSPLFGQTLAVQLQQALQATGTHTLCEFGAGTGALAEQLLEALDARGVRVAHYLIVDLSGTLRQRQAQRLARFGDRVQWLDRWPDRLEAVVVANEMLDALPVNLLHWDGQQWWERGVCWAGEGFAWSDRPTRLRPPVEGVSPTDDGDDRMDWSQRFSAGTVIEIHPQGEAFLRSLAGCLTRGAAFLIDYGFPEREYYHPQRTGGTLMCHRGHRADTDPLIDVGLKDITAHVNFTAMALTAQEAGMAVLGYTSQARFLMNCGIVERMAALDELRRGMAARLITEHEMGELFKVIALGVGEPWEPMGFVQGDRSHAL